MTEEGRRLEEARQPSTPWKKWGPYLSERQWVSHAFEDAAAGGR